jgi:hypothetical protein
MAGEAEAVTAAVLVIGDEILSGRTHDQSMIETGDGQGLFDLFTRTRAIRKGIVE